MNGADKVEHRMIFLSPDGDVRIIRQELVTIVQPDAGWLIRVKIIPITPEKGIKKFQALLHWAKHAEYVKII